MSTPMQAAPLALAPPRGAPTLAREPLQQGGNIRVGEDILADPHVVRSRLLAQRRWNLGYPHGSTSKEESLTPA